MLYRIRSPYTKQKIGRRSACLLIFGIIQFAIGFAICLRTLTVGETRTIPALEYLMPAEGYAWLWMGFGLVVLISAFLRRSQQRPAFSLAYTMPVVWSLGYLISWLLGLTPIGWLAAIVYAGYAMIVIVVADWNELPVIERRRD